MATCCHAVEPRPANSRKRTFAEIAGWAFSGLIFVLIPKCPACLAAHLAIWTGLGISFSTAVYLRWSLLALGGTAVLSLVCRRLVRYWRTDGGSRPVFHISRD